MHFFSNVNEISLVFYSIPAPDNKLHYTAVQNIFHYEISLLVLTRSQPYVTAAKSLMYIPDLE